MLRLLSFLLGVAVTAPAWAAGKPIVTDARVGVHAAITRFVLQTDSPIKPQDLFTLPNPYRVVIDLPAVGRNSKVLEVQPGAGLITRFRFGVFRPQTSRVVLDLRSPVRVRGPQMLVSRDGQSHRLVIDLEAVSAKVFERERRAAKRTKAAESTAASFAAHPPLPSPKPKRASAKRIIVLDPGHGGIDPGATQGKKILEKNITLAVAERITRELEKSSRYSVLLTRDGDSFLSLHERTMVARERLADLFISIHADSIRKHDIRGASVYRVSDKASDEEANALAQRENQADVLAGVEGFDSYDDSTRNLLVKFQQGKAQERAIHFSGMLIEALRWEKVRLLREPRRHAGFVVLKAPEVPSVLVELGYLSNHQDAGLLTSPKHQAKLARAVRRAVDRYFTDEISMN